MHAIICWIDMDIDPIIEMEFAPTLTLADIARVIVMEIGARALLQELQ